MKKQYQVIRGWCTVVSKPHIFDTLEEAIKCAEKMNKTGKTKARITYGYISNNGYTVTDPEIIVPATRCGTVEK